MSALPRDQAAELRLLMARRSVREAAVPASPRRRTARVVAVASGKGGVGKTSMAVNLAVRVSQMGRRVVLVDADLGTANADVLLNVNATHDLSSLVTGEATLDDVLSPVQENLSLIAGASGLASMADLGLSDRQNLLDDLARLEARCDVIIIDCGAGISQNVLAFAAAADELFLVTTPEPTAITDAYALVKVLSMGDRMPAVGVVMNQAMTEQEGREAGQRLVNVAARFLNIEIAVIGHIPRDEYVGRAVRARRPFVTQYPRCAASNVISTLANRIAQPAQAAEPEAGFFRRLFGFFH